MSTKITGAMQKELNGRINALPSDYQIVFYEISNYLWQFASSSAGVPSLQVDVLDMFETGAQNGRGVFDIVGEDVVAFCDGLLAEIPEHTWLGQMKASLNQSIHRKLGRVVEGRSIPEVQDTPFGELIKRLIEEQHSLMLSVVLHLIPGVVILAVYLLIGTPLVQALGYPPYLALVIAMCLALAPLELGLLLYLGWKKNGRFSLRGIVHYLDKPLKTGALIGYVTVLIIGLYVASVILTPVDSLVYNGLFSWIPFESAAGGASGFLTGYPRSTVILTLAVSLILTGVLLPAIEELYFRGFLLPRLSHLGGWAPILNQILFSLYHFWTPWQFVSRIGFFLPTVWVTWRKKDLRVSLWVHCLSNTMVTLLSIVAILFGASF